MGGNFTCCKKRRIEQSKTEKNQEIESNRIILSNSNRETNCLKCVEREKKDRLEEVKKETLNVSIGIQTDKDLAFSLFLEKKKEFEKMAQLFNFPLNNPNSGMINSNSVKEKIQVEKKNLDAKNEKQNNPGNLDRRKSKQISSHSILEKDFKKKNNPLPKIRKNRGYYLGRKKLTSTSSLARELQKKKFRKKKIVIEADLDHNSLEVKKKDENNPGNANSIHLPGLQHSKSLAPQLTSTHQQEQSRRAPRRISSINTIKMFDNVEEKKINHFYKKQLEKVNLELKRRFQNMGVIEHVKRRELRKGLSSDAVGTPRTLNSRDRHLPMNRDFSTISVNPIFKRSDGNPYIPEKLSEYNTERKNKSAHEDKNLILNNYDFPKNSVVRKKKCLFIKGINDNLSESFFNRESEKKFSMLFPGDTDSDDSVTSSEISGNPSVFEKLARNNSENNPSQKNGNSPLPVKEIGNLSVKNGVNKSAFFYKSIEPIKCSVFKSKPEKRGRVKDNGDVKNNE